MPRSVNHVASRAKRKRILKLTRGYFGARKNDELFSPDGSSLKGWYRDQPQGAR